MTQAIDSIAEDHQTLDLIDNSPLPASLLVPLTEEIAEARKYPRIAVRLPGRFMLPSGEEGDVHSLDVSCGGMAIEFESQPDGCRNGTALVLQFRHLGILNATIVRQLPYGVAIEFDISESRRDKISNYLTYLVNREVLTAQGGDRRHERIVPLQRMTLLTTAAGSQHMTRLIDVSRSGAAFTSSLGFKVGDKVLLGRQPAIVKRELPDGAAVEFEHEIAAEDFDEAIRL